MIRWTALSCSLLATLYVGAAVVSAQTVPTPESYTSQLATYRSDEHTFQIAKNQYFQLHTLAALEDAVKSTRQVMLDRATVLTTSFQILKQALQQTRGLDIGDKTILLKNADLVLTDLKNHQQQVNTATDRTKLLAVATAFVPLNTEIAGVQDQITTFIAYGNLQSVYDKTVAVKAELLQDVQHNETDPLKLAAKQRGLDEIERNLNELDLQLKAVKGDLENPQAQASRFQTNDKLSQIYGGLSRSITYLQELAKP